MWQLKYGVDCDRNLITIEEVTSGKTNLVCPFCGCEASRRHRALTAKKGKIKQHHFAHTGETFILHTSVFKLRLTDALTNHSKVKN